MHVGMYDGVLTCSVVKKYEVVPFMQWCVVVVFIKRKKC